MKNKLYIIATISFGALIIFGAVFWGKYIPNLHFSSQSPKLFKTPVVTQTEEPKLIDSLSLGTFSSNNKQALLDVSVEGVNGTTVRVFWDDTKLDVFHLVVLDAKELRAQSAKTLVWAMSSLKEAAFSAYGVVKQTDVKGFIPSGYALGTIIPEFSASLKPTNGLLTIGKKYYVQVNGFAKNGSMVTVNKEFTFTSSCFAPDCK